MFLAAVLVVAALSIGFALLLSRISVEPDAGGLDPGDLAPEINAAGWLNGEPPRGAGRPGRVTFVHGWFTTCPHCRTRAPTLVALHERYGGRGVDFVGLTYEGPELLPEIEDYVHDTGMTWPNGYGAVKTLQGFRAEYYPCAWLIGPDGRVWWNSGYGESPVEAIERALAAGESNTRSRSAN